MLETRIQSKESGADDLDWLRHEITDRVHIANQELKWRCPFHGYLLQHDRSSFLSSSFPSRCGRGRTGHFISGRNFDLPTTSLGWSVLDSAYCLLGVKYPAAADSAQSLSWANKDSDPARKENDDNTTEPATGEVKDKAAVKKRKMRE